MSERLTEHNELSSGEIKKNISILWDAFSNTQQPIKPSQTNFITTQKSPSILKITTGETNENGGFIYRQAVLDKENNSVLYSAGVFEEREVEVEEEGKIRKRKKQVLNKITNGILKNTKDALDGANLILAVVRHNTPPDA